MAFCMSLFRIAQALSEGCFRICWTGSTSIGKATSATSICQGGSHLAKVNCEVPEDLLVVPVLYDLFTKDLETGMNS